jgi:hypothetical protein
MKIVNIALFVILITVILFHAVERDFNRPSAQKISDLDRCLNVIDQCQELVAGYEGLLQECQEKARAE